MSKVRIAVVGCGAIARRAHVPVYVSNPDVEIIALVDPVEEASIEIKRRNDLKCSVYPDLEELFDKCQPDVVDICSPSVTHYPFARRSLEAGCNVLVEKPPAPTVYHAEELIALADTHNLKLGTILNYRY